MAKQPENTPDKPDFLSHALNNYGRYTYLPGEPAAQATTDLYTITIWKQVSLKSESGSEGKSCYANGTPPTQGWLVKRVEPAAPLDFMEYYGRKN